ncbi:MAG: hypothetical protein M3044_17405 [Thermoproteota archaeon]|nr:hypothetical protein [Thermoproteota archaeon]
MEILRLMERQRRSKQHEQSIQESQPQLKQQSIFIALAQAAKEALADDELRAQTVGGVFI